jgi:hypothetical protein
MLKKLKAMSTTTKANDKKVNGKGVNPSAPVAPAAAPAAAAPAAKPAVLLALKKMPTIKGQKAGRKGSNGVKRLLYMIFAVAYANWTSFGRFIANGQLKNVYVEGLPETPENRIWIVQSETTGEILHTFQGTAASKLHVVAAGTRMIPMQELDETITKLAGFEKNMDLADYFTKLAIATTDEALKAAHTATAAKYAAENNYGGYAVTTKENIDQVVSNVRDYYERNPETTPVFAEILNYTAAFGQVELLPILNVELDAAQKAAAKTAKTATANA